MNDGGDTLLVDADSRTATRWIILRAMSGGALVNDYRLRIVAGSDGLQNPGLRFTDSVGTLAVNATHDFAATHSGSGAITWSVTNPDGSSTTLATITPTTGALTANGGGMVKVIASCRSGWHLPGGHHEPYAGYSHTHQSGLERCPGGPAHWQRPDCPIQRHPGRDG